MTDGVYKEFINSGDTLRVYNGETAPLIDYYRKQDILKKINGNVSVEKVFNQLCNVIDNK